MGKDDSTMASVIENLHFCVILLIYVIFQFLSGCSGAICLKLILWPAKNSCNRCDINITSRFRLLWRERDNSCGIRSWSDETRVCKSYCEWNITRFRYLDAWIFLEIDNIGPTCQSEEESRWQDVNGVTQHTVDNFFQDLQHLCRYLETGLRCL